MVEAEAPALDELAADSATEAVTLPDEPDDRLTVSGAEAACGPGHPALAIPLGNLAAVLRDLGRAEEARPLAEQALAIDEAAYGPGHPTVAIRLYSLAAVLRDLGRVEEAWLLAERAAAIRRKA